MTLSNIYTFNLDKDGIIGEAYSLAGATALGEKPVQDELISGSRMLNIFLKGLQTEGVNLWLKQEVTLFPVYAAESFLLGPTGGHATSTSEAVKTEMKVAGVATDLTIDVDSIVGIADGDYIGVELDDDTIQWTTVSGAPGGDTVTITDALTDGSAIDSHVYAYTNKIQRPKRIIEARRIDSNGYSTPLFSISRQEYMSLSSKASKGIVNQYYYDPQLTDGAFYVWQSIGNVQDIIRMTIAKPIMDFVAGASTGEFPVEWLDAIISNMALRISVKLKMPPDKDLKKWAEDSLFMARTWDEEDSSTYFQPGEF